MGPAHSTLHALLSSLHLPVSMFKKCLSEAASNQDHTNYVFCIPSRPPSDWNPALALRSARLPEEQLQLEWVYGYDV